MDEPFHIFLETWIKVAWKSHKQAFAEEFSEPGGVSGGRFLRVLAGKSIAIVGKIPRPKFLEKRIKKEIA